MAEKYVNGITIGYTAYGDKNNPPLFLTHGVTADRNHWTDIAKRLEEDYYVITYDCRGHGKSTKPEKFSMEDMGHDLVALIEAFGYDSVYAAGCSMGGMVLLTAAGFTPDKFKKIMPIVTACHSEGGLLREVYENFNVADPSALTPEEDIRISWEAIWCPDTPEEKRVIATYEPLTSEQIDAAQNAIKYFDARPNMAKVVCPALVISGKHDRLIAPKHGREIADILPNSEFIIYEKSGHRLMGEETDRLVEQMRDFFA